MAKRRKKKILREIYPSIGPLPERLAADYAGRVLVFSDASLKRQGGLAAVIFGPDAGEPLILTRSVATDGSNELELQAALFALQHAVERFPGEALALFSDNHDAVSRLSLAMQTGADGNEASGGLLSGISFPRDMVVRWIKGHGTCRGNWLADRHAAEAAA